MTKKQFFEIANDRVYYGLAQRGLNAKEIKDKKLRALWEKYVPAYKELELIEREMEEYLNV